jgi:glycosyltransferase involved in cell wall biosynthesis
LNIGIESKRIFNNHTGLGVYGRNLLKGLTSNQKISNIYLFTPSNKLKIDYNQKNIFYIYPKYFFKFFKSIWRSIFLGLFIPKKVNVFHGISGELPFFIPKNIKKVVTIHDVLFMRFPEDFSFWDRWIHFYKFKRAAQISDQIITVSAASSEDIQKYFKIPPNKIHVIPNAFSFNRSENKQKKYIEKLPYVVCISSFLSRKNQLQLVKVFLETADKHELNLVLVGRQKGDYYKKIQQEVLNSKFVHRIIFKENLKDAEILDLYQNACFAVYPSLYEGFGLPILEALVNHCPILVNDFKAAREISEDLPVFFDTNDVLDLKEKWFWMIENYQFQREKIRKNMDTLIKNFSIEQVVSKTIEIYQK